MDFNLLVLINQLYKKSNSDRESCFIGSNLVKKRSKQHSVTVINDLSTGRIIAHIEKVDFIKGSITDLGLPKHADAERIFT
jgi:nucleoside-diphosphate-sugar epimerase